MRYSNILFITLLALLTSCTSESEIVVSEEQIDFSGVYEGELNCKGALSADQGESILIAISKTGTVDSYSIDLGDEVIFSGIQVNNVLNIGAQTINEGQGFDVVSMEGEIKMIDGEMMFEFTHSVDDEGESACFFPLIKK